MIFKQIYNKTKKVAHIRFYLVVIQTNDSKIKNTKRSFRNSLNYETDMTYRQSGLNKIPDEHVLWVNDNNSKNKLHFVSRFK